MAEAACRGMGPDPWFPNLGDSTREAKKVCAGCPVVDECRRYALDTDAQAGIWAGVTVSVLRRQGR
jgi:WhiB family redox-sensing transcriptional regulator